MKLTCVTAVYNAIAAGNKESLIRCARSVASLKTEHEHLFVDGGSTDGTIDLLTKLAAEIPTMKFKSERDTGIYNALNKGLSRAQGEWFYVLGCDDYLSSPAVLDKVLADHAECSDAIVAPVVYDPDPNYAFHRLADLKNFMFWGYGYCHQGLLARTNVLREFGGFDESYRICADGDLMMKLHLAGKRFVYTFEPYANFAAGGANETAHDVGVRETQRFLAANLGMTNEEAVLATAKETPPLRLGLRFAYSRDLALRISARHILRVHKGLFIERLKRTIKRLIGWKARGD